MYVFLQKGEWARFIPVKSRDFGLDLDTRVNALFCGWSYRYILDTKNPRHRA